MKEAGSYRRIIAGELLEPLKVLIAWMQTTPWSFPRLIPYLRSEKFTVLYVEKHHARGFKIAFVLA